MIAGCGAMLSIDGYATCLKRYLLPTTLIATPNIYEAEQLSAKKINGLKDAEKAAMEIGKICNVIVTGGHLDGQNVFYNGSVMVIEGDIVGKILMELVVHILQP